MLRFAHLASLAAAFAACLVVSVPTGSGGVGSSSFGPTPAPSTTTSTTSTVTTATSSATSACGSGPAIVAITTGTPVTGYSLAGGGTPILISGTNHYPYTFAQFISRQCAADNCLNIAYFNLHDNGNSYIPISWDVGRKLTLDWDGSSSAIQTRNHTQWGVQSWFLTCQEQGYWAVYLQTGKDTPSGETCYLTQLQATN